MSLTATAKLTSKATAEGQSKRTALRVERKPAAKQTAKADEISPEQTREPSPYTHNFGAVPLYPGRQPFVQPKLTVNTPGDKFEQEADSMADKVMRMAEPSNVAINSSHSVIQRECSKCNDEEKTVHREENSNEKIQYGDELDTYISSLNSSGQLLPQSSRQFFEPRFGHDFSNVRIHNDDAAAKSAQAINANAYTSGNNIVFNHGQYAPNNENGQRLLAHELVHTIQQGRANTIYRQPKVAPPPPKLKKAVDPADEDAVNLEKEILNAPEFTKLAWKSQQRIRSIIARAKIEPGKRLYYLGQLKTAITTPFNGKSGGGEEYQCSPELEKKTRKAVDDALIKEKKDWDGLYNDVEEQIVSTSLPKDKKVRRGEGKTFIADGSDPNNIRVMIKIKLNGLKDDVAKIKQLEDAIERAIAMPIHGYHLDIVFVDTSGPDVFEFTVNFCKWPNSGNWASGPMTLSHEVHHALGLNDRYDYIENQSTNPDMNVEMRLVWFEEEMKKQAPKDLPNNPNSKMAINSNPLLNDDVCAVAFEPGPERDDCIKQRDGFDKWGF